MQHRMQKKATRNSITKQPAHTNAETAFAVAAAQTNANVLNLYPISFQQLQKLLTLFTEFFSPFPHGTCVLSGSCLYLALDEIYHLLCVPRPRNVTTRVHAVCNGPRVAHGALTRYCRLPSQGLITRESSLALHPTTIQQFQLLAQRPALEMQISECCSSLFIRHY